MADIATHNVIGYQYGFQAFDADGQLIGDGKLDDKEGPAAKDGEITPTMQAIRGAASFAVHEHFLLDTPSGWMEDGVKFLNPLTKEWMLCRRDPADKEIAPHKAKLGDDIDVIAISAKDAEQADPIAVKPWPDVTVIDGEFVRDSKP